MFHHLLKTNCFDQAFGSPEWLTQVPQIWPLVDTVHFIFYLLTYLHSVNFMSEKSHMNFENRFWKAFTGMILIIIITRICSLKILWVWST